MKLRNIILCLLAIVNYSCEEFVQIDPPKTQLVREAAFRSDESAHAAIRGIYNQMINDGGFASGNSSSVTLLAGLSADEFESHTSGNDLFYSYSLDPRNSAIKNLWDTGYKYIYYANAAMEGLAASTGVSEAVRKQLIGESKFNRAFCNFYLVNLFGQIPIITGTGYQDNATAIRKPISEVYDHIILDLTDATSMLDDSYNFSNGERVRANKWAATALLARVFLYTGNWNNAIQQATFVINQTDLFKLVPDPQNVFLKNSDEAIWQLMPVSPGANTNEARIFLPPSAQSPPTFVSLSHTLLESFESGDNRKTSWTDNSVVNESEYHYPKKYKVRVVGEPLTEYSMVIRLAELYLIRAEALAKLGRLSEAIADVDVIRARAGLSLIQDTDPAMSQAELLSRIEHERQIEFFAEWGHRWFDLKRTDRCDEVLGQLKPEWQPVYALYPIPKFDRDNNSNLSQNPGY